MSQSTSGLRLRRNLITRLTRFGLILSLIGFPEWASSTTLVHTNDVMGDLEPCGCRNNPQGGMARKANLVKRLPDSDVIQVDAGDLLFSTLDVPEMLKQQSKVQARYLLKSMDLLHHDATVPGEKDFSLGLKTFQELRKATRVQFLAANLTLRSGQKFLEPHLLIQRGSRVALIGVVGSQLRWPKELRVSSAVEAVRREVAWAKSQKADAIVVLSHQGFDEDVQLARTVTGIDVIVGGHTQSFLQKPVMQGKTWILQSSFKNQYIGVLPLRRPLDENQYQLIGLDAGYDSPAETPSEMDRLVKEFKESVARLNALREKNLQAQVEPSMGSDQKASFQTFPQCAQCHLKQFDFWRKTPHFRALHALVEKGQENNKECLSCHTLGLGQPGGFSELSQLGEWKQVDGADHPKTATPTVKDWSSFLTRVGEAKSIQDSIQVDFPVSRSMPVRQAIASLGKHWALPQCESCHQPGGDHPFSGNYRKTVQSQACLKCHTQERAPSWYKEGQPDLTLIQTKMKAVACPAGEFSETTD